MSPSTAWRSRIQAASSIIDRVPAKYEKACAEGDVLFFPSTTFKHTESGIEFLVRLCPALQYKPHLPTPHFEPTDYGLGAERGGPNPFLPPYNENLLVGELQSEQDDETAEYVVLLNKFSVVPNHFLLVTKEFQSQASPLSGHDLVQTYLLLLAARKEGQHFFAFFNCGDRSGASQRHKHLQFLPIEDEDGPPIETLARAVKLETIDKAFSINALPYANHICRLPSFTLSTSPDVLEEKLQQSFLTLLDLVIQTVRHDADYPAGRPSYNFILTYEHMHLIPRREEYHVLSETGDRLSINSLAYAGMMLVKNEEELEAVKKEGLGVILRSVALSPIEDQHIIAAHERDNET